MIKRVNYDKVKGLASLIKNQQEQREKQAVLSDTPVSHQEEQQLNVWIPKDLMKRLKIRGAETNSSLKEMVTDALNLFL